jgi:hypothetical protein
MATLIRVNDVYEPMIGKKDGDRTEDGPLTLDQVQKAVDGNFEVLQTVLKDMVICCDEEGCLKNKRLNVVASRLVDAPVVGDCLLVFTQDGEMY